LFAASILEGIEGNEEYECYLVLPDGGIKPHGRISHGEIAGPDGMIIGPSWAATLSRAVQRALLKRGINRGYELNGTASFNARTLSNLARIGRCSAAAAACPHCSRSRPGENVYESGSGLGSQ
jgi:hypothetical protein